MLYNYYDASLTTMDMVTDCGSILLILAQHSTKNNHNQDSNPTPPVSQATSHSNPAAAVPTPPSAEPVVLGIKNHVSIIKSGNFSFDPGPKIFLKSS